MSRFARASCTTTDYSGKPLRPGGSPGHPRGGRWIRRCCCRLAPGSLSSKYRCAARSSTSPSAARRRARTARTVAPGRKRSTAATSGTLPICRSPVGRPSSTYGSAGFAATSQSARARHSSSKHPCWQSDAHRTCRLRSMLESIGFSLGGRPGSRHCQRLAMPTSRTTLLRMVRAVPERPIEAPQVLGVDEFALRRGHRYGTILVDADAHRVIDLLEDPSADALVEWLGDHAGVEIICRDRDGVYASAARRGAPNALQVADRWHLTHNLAEALERFSVRRWQCCVRSGERKHYH